MKNSNEKSKECCSKCSRKQFGGGTSCIDSNCPCHKPSVEYKCPLGVGHEHSEICKVCKPSVEVSVCCGAKMEQFGFLPKCICSKCKKPFEPKSIPIERNEREEWTKEFVKITNLIDNYNWELDSSPSKEVILIISNLLSSHSQKLVSEAKRVVKVEIDTKISELLKEFANTPLDERRTGWDWLVRLRKELK